jgi:hypothetical protein
MEDKDRIVRYLFEVTCPAVIITDNGFFVVKLTTQPPGHKRLQGATGPDLKQIGYQHSVLPHFSL